MAIFNEAYITEFLFKKKDKKEYHHLNKQEITACIQIAKEEIKAFPKLKKASRFVNIYRDGEYGDPSPISEYYNNSGKSSLIIINGDAWDGYSSLRNDEVYDEYNKDSDSFAKNVREKIKEKNISADFYPTGNNDWDGIEFAIKSLKEK